MMRCDDWCEYIAFHDPLIPQVRERAELEKVCDQALVHVVELLGVEHVIGVGNYARDRARAALTKEGKEDIKVSSSNTQFKSKGGGSRYRRFYFKPMSAFLYFQENLDTVYTL